jgi:hypothetical protein
MGTEGPIRRRPRSRRVLAASGGALALALVMLAASDAGAIGVAKQPEKGEVTLGFDKAEPGRLVAGGIRVIRGSAPSAAEARTIYSVRLPRLRADQKVLVRGTVALTRCDESDQLPGGGAHVGTLHSPCESVRDPYSVPGGGSYDPEIAVRAFLGDDRADLSRGLGGWQVRRCTTALHHCPLDVNARIDNPRSRSGSTWLNLAVTAFSPRARVGARGHSVDVVELDGECQNHDFDPCEPVLTSASSNTHGGATAIRFGAARNPARWKPTKKLINGELRVQGSRHITKETKPRIIMRKRLDHLAPGDVIDASGSFHLRDHGGDGYVFRHEVSGLLFLSADPSALHPGSRGRWLAPSARTNCPHSSGCTITKLGAATVPEQGAKTMWVTLVGSARDSGGLNGAPMDISHGNLRVAVDGASDR